MELFWIKIWSFEMIIILGGRLWSYKLRVNNDGYYSGDGWSETWETEEGYIWMGGMNIWERFLFDLLKILLSFL